uniref:Uncharacterized protein n=1 Tax=Ditylenchus dipsaci TaxID=166011 RepID=A0A915CQ51_9BILA
MYTTPIRNDFDDSRYKCCCNIHVERAAYYIAFIGAGLSGIAAVSYFSQGNTLFGVSCLCNFFFHFSILYAQRTNKPKFYLPFLIVNILAIVLLIFSVIYLIAVFVIMPESHKERLARVFQDGSIKFSTEEEFLAEIRMTLVIAIAATALYTALVAYFYYIVYRAYMFMREKIAHEIPLRQT